MPFEQDFTVGVRLSDNADLEFGNGNDVALSSDGTNVNAVGAGLFIWPDDIFIVADQADLTARTRIDSGSVTGGSTRVLTMNDANVSLLLTPGNQLIADPGDAGAIAVTTSGNCPLVSAGAETRTIAIPTAVGQEVLLSFHTDAGDIIVTAAAAINQAGNTKMTFSDVGEVIQLKGIQGSAGALVWRVGINDGVALS